MPPLLGRAALPLSDGTTAAAEACCGGVGQVWQGEAATSVQAALAGVALLASGALRSGTDSSVRSATKEVACRWI